MSVSLDYIAADGNGSLLTSGSVTIAAGSRASGTGQVMGRITVSGKYVPINPAATDGSGTAAGVLGDVGFPQLSADTSQVIATAGLVRRAALLYSGLDMGQAGEVRRGLAVLGMLTTLGSAAEEVR